MHTYTNTKELTMNVQEINRAIMFGDLTDSELTAVVQAVRFARSNLQKRIKQSLQIGDNVEFTANKTGRRMRGFVTKVAIKYVTVNTGAGLWRVPANMLTKVQDFNEA